MKPIAPLKFKPRIMPRNWIDWGLGLLFALVSLTVGVVFYATLLWVGYLIMGFAWMFWNGSYLVGLVVFAALLYGAIMPALRLEFSEEGIRVVRRFKTMTVLWDEIESVEELSPSELARRMFHHDFYSGRMASPGSFTFTDYVLIPHKRGSVLFPPQNKEIFLHELWKHRERKEAEQNEVTPKTTPWYWTAQTLREENQQTLRSRSLD